MTRKPKGRIGDSPIIGAGTYADSSLGGVSCTGYGEQIIRATLAKTTLSFIEFCQMNAQQASDEGIKRLGQLPNGEGGLIAIDAHGAIGAAGNGSHMPRAFMSDTMDRPSVRLELP
jgi:beta-aspartyl-peptidase (threonine type)